MKKVFLFAVSAFALLMIGACGSQPPAPPPPPPPAAEEPAPPPPAPAPVTQSFNRHSSGIILDGAVTHKVIWRDTLSNIARRYYQDGSYYPLIFMVSGDTITDIDRIIPDTVLTVPDLQANLNDATARDSLRRFMLDIAQIEESRRRAATARLIRESAAR